MSDNPIEQSFNAHMDALRAVAQNMKRDGFTVVIAGCFDDPMPEDDGCVSCFNDYAIYGSTFSGLGLIEVVRNRVHAAMQSGECERE